MSKTYQRQWNYKGAIIRQREQAYQVEINFRGRRIRATKASLAEAKTLIVQRQTELSNEGTAALSLTTGQRYDAAKAIRLLPAGVSLEAAAKEYSEALAIWRDHGLVMQSVSTVAITNQQAASDRQGAAG